MRTFITTLVVTVMLVATSIFAQDPVHQGQAQSLTAVSSSAAEVVKHPDSERVAQTFAGRKIKEFKDAGYVFARYENAKFSEWVQAEFEMTTKGKVPYLVINGKVIVKRGDPPLDGLPPNTKGEARDFHLWISAYADNNQRIGDGSFDKALWLPRDSISVKLDPIDTHVLVSFAVPDGVDPKNLHLQLQDKYNSSFWYNEYTRGFDVWVDPLFPVEYEIIDVSTRIIYGRGTLDTLTTTSVKESDVSVVSVLLPEGVVQVSFEERDYVFYERQTFSGHVMRGENCPSLMPPAPTTCGRTEVPAKVYFADLNQDALFVSVFSDSNDRFVIEVRRWKEKGEMPLIAKTTGDQPYLQIGRGYDRVVITILPLDPKKSATDFYVDLSKY